MPRWARFLSCSLTGLLLCLIGFLLTAYWWEGNATTYWPLLLNFMAMPDFWSLVSLFGLLCAGALLLGRIAVHLYGMAGAMAGLLCGALVALAYAAFLISLHAADWGGWSPSLQKSWPSAALFALPFALSGAFTTWLWERLD
jgi:hypothetical protein